MTHISNVFSTFHFDTILPHVFQVKKMQHACRNMTRSRALCPRNGTVRNVRRTSFQDKCSLTYCKFKIDNTYNAFGDTYPPGALCATFGARLRSIPLGILDHLLGQLGSQDRPRTSGRVTSVGGSAMHMKIPDHIGREAGIGRTQNRKELSYAGLTRVDRPSVE